jgi:hypothetical protein
MIRRALIAMRGRKRIHSVSSREYKYGVFSEDRSCRQAGMFREVFKKEVLHAAEKRNESYRSSLN